MIFTVNVSYVVIFYCSVSIFKIYHIRTIVRIWFLFYFFEFLHFSVFMCLTINSIVSLFILWNTERLLLKNLVGQAPIFSLHAFILWNLRRLYINNFPIFFVVVNHWHSMNFIFEFCTSETGIIYNPSSHCFSLSYVIWIVDFCIHLSEALFSFCLLIYFRLKTQSKRAYINWTEAGTLVALSETPGTKISLFWHLKISNPFLQKHHPQNQNLMKTGRKAKVWDTCLLPWLLP